MFFDPFQSSRKTPTRRWNSQMWRVGAPETGSARAAGQFVRTRGASARAAGEFVGIRCVTRNRPQNSHELCDGLLNAEKPASDAESKPPLELDPGCSMFNVRRPASAPCRAGRHQSHDQGKSREDQENCHESALPECQSMPTPRPPTDAIIIWLSCLSGAPRNSDFALIFSVKPLPVVPRPAHQRPGHWSARLAGW
jgi:hypothetical protein